MASDYDATFAIRTTREMKAALEKIAARAGKTLTYIVRPMLDTGIKRAERETKREND